MENPSESFEYQALRYVWSNGLRVNAKAYVHPKPKALAEKMQALQDDFLKNSAALRDELDAAKAESD